MIKNFPQSLMALVCAIGLTLASCKKDTAIQPDASVTESSTLSRSTLATSAIGDATIESGFTLGVNGHPLGDDAYLAVSAATQIDMIKKMGMGIYRINILSTSDGSCTVPKVLQPLLDAAAAGKVTLLPMLTPRTLSYSDTESDAYAKGKALGGNFAAKYASVFKYYDMGNDLDVNTILSGKDGRVAEDYNQQKLVVTAAYLKGMNDGIHANDPDAQTMISAGWVHWGFIKFCQNYGVNFDVLAYHWYSDMEAGIARSPSYKVTDITLTLNGLFPGKPIWITETNFRTKELNATVEANQNTFLTNFIAKCKANPTVKAVLVYELFDEPYKKNDEQFYGIAKWAAPYSQWLNKLVADSFVKITADAAATQVQPTTPAKPDTTVTPATPTAPTTPVTPVVTTPVVPVVTTPVTPVVTTPVVPVVTAPVVTELLTQLIGFTAATPQASKLSVGATYYTDRDYQITSLPDYLTGASLIKTANGDKISNLSSYVSFSLGKASTVYVAYDPRASRLPAWLQGFTKVNEKIGVNDPKLSSMNLYKKDYPAGTVTLPGNMAGSLTGALCQYVVAVK